MSARVQPPGLTWIKRPRGRAVDSQRVAEQQDLQATGDAQEGVAARRPFEQAPGQADQEFAALDDPQLWPEFFQRIGPVAAAPHWESHLSVGGMRCAGCALALEQTLRAVPGVLEAQVGSASARARVVWSSAQALPSDWMRAAKAAGFDLLPAQNAQAQAQRRRDARLALWRWLVAGFCMMQIMMYATPAYFAQPGEIAFEDMQLMRWASWALSLPVLLFCATPFFRAAGAGLRERRISMDLPVALGILLTFGASSLGTFDPLGRFGREVYFDSLSMFVFFLLGGRWLEARLRQRTLGSLDALADRLPHSVLRLLAGGGVERVSAQRLRLGDRLRVLPGEAFAADGVLTQGVTSVDEALLTGESRPLPRRAGEPVIAGSFNLGGVVEMQVQGLGKDTRYGEIAVLMQSAATTKPRMAALADRMALPFLWAVLIAAALAAAYWWPQDPGHALAVAAAVLVVTCPCALSLATPAALLTSAGALARRGVLVRRLDALEALAGVDTVVFDKTGTLTQGRMALAATRTQEGLSEAQALAMAAALARHSLHPLSKALLAAFEAQGQSQDAWVAQDVAEQGGQGVRGGIRPLSAPKGQAPRWASLGSALLCGIADADAARPSVHLSDAQGWLASFEFAEQLRPDAAQTVAMLRQAGLQVLMFSGDQHSAAARIAGACGIEQAVGRCTPQDKLSRLAAMQAAGRKVAMVGDGLNDGPVLARADASFAMAQAVPLARAQSDFAVMGERLGEVAVTLLHARRAMRVVRQNLYWAAAYNAACVPLAVLGFLPAWLAGLGMALSSLLVVANAGRLVRIRSGEDLDTGLRRCDEMRPVTPAKVPGAVIPAKAGIQNGASTGHRPSPV